MGGLLLAILATGQVYDHQIGTPASREVLTDGIVVGASTSETSIAVGITNVGGHDQVLVTGLSNAYGNMIFQKRHQVLVPSGITGKTKTVINSVKIANDPNVVDNTCLIAGSYFHSNLSQSIYYSFGVFTALLDETTGNLSNIKRWESGLSNIGGIRLAAAYAAQTNTVYLTGDIQMQTGTINRQFAMALNGTTNNLVWSNIFYDVAYDGSLYPADITFYPYDLNDTYEVVIAGTTRPTNSALPKMGFITRLDAYTGVIIANTYFGDNTSTVYGVSAITPSKSAAGVPDGFMLCGNAPNGSGINQAWAFKVPPTCNAVIWNKQYTYTATGGEFTSSDIAEALNASEPNSYYVNGSTFSSAVGTTYDAAVIKVDANGNVIRFFSYVPPAGITGKHEYNGKIVSSSIYNVGACIFGTRAEPSNPLLSDMFTVRVMDDGISCELPLSRSHTVTNLTHTPTAFSMTPVGTLGSLTVNNTPHNFSGFVTHCYLPTLLGGRQAETGQTLSPEKNTGYSLFPNPANEMLTLQLPGTDDPETMSVSLLLFDISGRMVREERVTAQQLTVDIKTLNNGIYFYEIRKAGQMAESGKIVIAH